MVAVTERVETRMIRHPVPEVLNGTSLRKSCRKPPKRLGPIKLHPLPTPQQYRSWRNNTRSEIAAASNKPEACFRWVLEAEAPTATYDLLADSGEFGTLDISLPQPSRRWRPGKLAGRSPLRWKPKPNEVVC